LIIFFGQSLIRLFWC